MRDIKFRVWDKTFTKILNAKNIVINANSGLCKGKDGGNGYMDDWELMQYTGLEDKNGIDIYEGDIVTSRKYNVYAEKEQYINGDVCFVQGCFKVNGRIIEDLANIEVIGNIYENGDLIK